MCSNISTDTTRSKRCSVLKSFMSAVTTSTLVRPAPSARARMDSRCGAELETAVMRLLGYASAIHRVSEPQPQPSSSTRWPSRRSARAQVSARAASSAASRPAVPGRHRQPLYLRR